MGGQMGVNWGQIGSNWDRIGVKWGSNGGHIQKSCDVVEELKKFKDPIRVVDMFFLNR